MLAENLPARLVNTITLALKTADVIAQPEISKCCYTQGRAVLSLANVQVGQHLSPHHTGQNIPTLTRSEF